MPSGGQSRNNGGRSDRTRWRALAWPAQSGIHHQPEVEHEAAKKPKVEPRVFPSGPPAGGPPEFVARYLPSRRTSLGASPVSLEPPPNPKPESNPQVYGYLPREALQVNGRLSRGSPLVQPPCGEIHEHGRRRAHAEGLHPAPQRNRDQRVARRGDPRAQAAPFGAQHEHHGTAVIDRFVAERGVWCRAIA